MTDDRLVEIAKRDMAFERAIHGWNRTQGQSGGTAQINVLIGHVDTKGYREVFQYACHHPIHQFLNAEVLWSAWKHNTSNTVAEFFLHWLVTKSPWSKLGVNFGSVSDEKFLFNQGFVFTDLDKTPGNVLHSFLIASRMAAEWPDWIQSWYNVVTTAGIDPALVFAFLTMFTPKESPWSCLRPGTKSKPSLFNQTDWPINQVSCDEQYIVNFVKGVTVNPSPEPFSPSAETLPINSLWGNCNVVGYGSYLNQLVARYSDKFSETVEEKHFAGVPTTVQVWPVDNIIKVMKLEQERLGL